ncbi:MAG TPA: WYL domain-containing protein [Kofleriaceae bacterium]|nr:WYL domain-containing protein [Kofleriaceae bacterium]
MTARKRSKLPAAAGLRALARPVRGKRVVAKGKKPGRKEDGSRGDRSKRLLDLVMMLLRARGAVTYRDIREQFDDYQTTNAEAGLRAFERDKADLLELGVPIRYVTPEEDDALEDGGYVIDLKRLRLPEVRLTPDEVSALVLAASVAHAMPGGAYPKIVDLALKKLAFDLPEMPDTPTEFPRPASAGASGPASGSSARASARSGDTVLVHFPGQRAVPGRGDLGELFAVFEAATRFRKRVTFTYQTAANGVVSKRTIDPYALVYRDSSWLVVGWCHLRGEVRSFRVDRASEAVMAPKPKSPDFERPEGFDVRSYAQRSPWTFTTEPTELVELSLSAEAADVANEDFGPAADVQHQGDQILIRFPCGNPEFAVSRVLASKGAIIVRQGERLSQRLAEELSVIAARYA